jgi:arsenite-transporting ATPase
LQFASKGKKTLAISTDATPSLSHIFEKKDDSRPTRVEGSLYFSELGIEEVEEMWNKKFGLDVYNVFSSFVDVSYEEFLDFTTAMVPGLRDEFMVDYIKDLVEGGEYDTVVWDTAPLGQTLALLNTPAMLVEHLRMAPRIYSRLKLSNVTREPILQIIKRWQSLSAEDNHFLRTRVCFVLVTIPEALAVEQLQGVFGEFERYGLSVARLIVNNVIKADGSKFLLMKSGQQKGYLEQIYTNYSDLEISEVPMFPYEMKGVEKLKEIRKALFD